MKNIFIAIILFAFADMACAQEFDDQSLLSLNPSYFYKGKGTPAEFMANSMADGAPKKALLVLSGELKGDKDAARKALREYKDAVAMGLQWKCPRMKIEIPQLPCAPEMDGTINAAEWNGAYVFEGQYPLNSAEKASGFAQWRIAWAGRSLFVCAEFANGEPHVNDARPWDGDSLEVFLLPDPKMKVYRETVASPSGKTFTSLHANRKWGGFTPVDESERPEIKAGSKFQNGRLTFEIEIPFSTLPNYALGNQPEIGQTLDFSLVRTQDVPKSSPFPLLYGGHNIFGYAKGVLGPVNGQGMKKGN